MITVACRCGAHIDVPEKYAGRTLECKKCGAKNAVPDQSSGEIEHATETDRTMGVSPNSGIGIDATSTSVNQSKSDTGNDSGSRQSADLTASLTSFLSPPQNSSEVGRLGGYRIIKILGAGGMGVVFQAEDLQLRRTVALKVMLPALAANEVSRERFLREARAIAALEHDHIVAIYQVGEDRNIPFLAMQFLQGETLADRVKRLGKLDVAEVLRIGREIALGLAAAHEHGLIHRDIKPANIWLETKGTSAGSASGEITKQLQSNGGRVKILDFGLAREVDEDVHITKDGMITGTPAYMSPEQLDGKAPDSRSDLFSLGCVLYEMATGRRPFQGATTITLIKAILLEDPRAPAKLNGSVPSMLSDLILKLLAKTPTDRPKSARSLATALKAIEEATAAPIKVEPLPPLPDKTEELPKGEVTRTVKTRTSSSPKTEKIPVRTSEKDKTVVAFPRWVIPVVGSVMVVVIFGIGISIGLYAISQIGPKGTLVIDAGDPEMEVIVKQGSKVIVERTPRRQFELPPGQYDIQLANPRQEWVVARTQVKIEEGAQEVVRIEVRLAKGPADKGEKVEKVDGPFLGIRLETSEGGAKVLHVIPGGAAESVGFFVNDVIHQIGAENVTGHQALITALQRHKPGDRVFLKVKRDGNFMTLAVTLGRAPARGASQFRKAVDIDGAAYQVWVNQMSAEQFRPFFVHVYKTEKGLRFAAIATKSEYVVGWKARHHIAPDRLEIENEEMNRQGMRLICLSEYMDGANNKVAAIWRSDPRKIETRFQVGVKAEELAKELAQHKKEGRQPIFLSAHPVEKAAEFSFIVTNERLSREFAFDKESGQLSSWIKSWSSKGYRPISLAGYDVEAGARFAMVMSLDKEMTNWHVSRDLTLAGFYEKDAEMTGKGQHLISITGYTRAGGTRYAGIWSKEEF